MTLIWHNKLFYYQSISKLNKQHHSLAHFLSDQILFLINTLIVNIKKKKNEIEIDF